MIQSSLQKNSSVISKHTQYIFQLTSDANVAPIAIFLKLHTLLCQKNTYFARSKQKPPVTGGFHHYNHLIQETSQGFSIFRH